MRALRRNHYTLLWCVVIVTTFASIMRVFAADPKDIPPPKGKYSEETLCVEPVEIMRRKHFDFILDHRDRTVIQGIRTKQYSLIGCIDCHITPDAQGKYARYSEETHFCASCHQFAAVTIDCFQCHADRPEEAIHKVVTSDKADTNSTQKIHEALPSDAVHSY